MGTCGTLALHKSNEGSTVGSLSRKTVAWAAGAALAVGGCTAGIVIAVQGGGRPATGGTAGAAGGRRAPAPLEPRAAARRLDQPGQRRAARSTARETITVTYNQPLPATAPLPTLSPAIAGSWQRTGDAAVFTPATGFPAGTHVTVTAAGLGDSRTRSESSSFKTGELQHAAPAGDPRAARLPAADLDAGRGRGGARRERRGAAVGGVRAARRDLPVAAGVPGAAALVLVAGQGEHPRPGGHHRLRGRPRAAHRRGGRAGRVEGAADGRRRRTSGTRTGTATRSPASGCRRR